MQASDAIIGLTPGWFREMFSRKLPILALAGLAFLVAIALLADFILPYGPIEQNINLALSKPTFAHWMGTDELGRDLMTRLVYGARVSLGVAIGTSFLALLFGTMWGAFSGYWGGRIDGLMMRVVDVIYSFPDLLIIILFM